MQITTIGLDIAKNAFQVHGIDAAEKVIVRKQLRRGQVMAFFEALAPCLVGTETCATSHYWARELTKLGHEVRLMPAKVATGLGQLGSRSDAVSQSCFPCPPTWAPAKRKRLLRWLATNAVVSNAQKG